MNLLPYSPELQLHVGLNKLVLWDKEVRHLGVNGPGFIINYPNLRSLVELSRLDFPKERCLKIDSNRIEWDEINRPHERQSLALVHKRTRNPFPLRDPRRRSCALSYGPP